MDEKEITILGKDKGYWWFKAKDELIESLVNKDNLILNIGSGVFPLKFAHNYKGKVDNLPYNDNWFNCVILADVLEHITDENIQASLKEIKRVLTQDGTFIITVPAHQWLFNDHDVFLEHKRRYSKKLLLKHLKDAGFKPTKIRYWNCILGIPLIIWKKLNRGGSDFIKLPIWLNTLLYRILKFEENIVFPFGITIVGVFRKNENNN